MTEIALVAFVKTPEVSPTKTRLAEKIGISRANEFYLRSLKATEAWMQSVQWKHNNVENFWAVAESDQLDHTLWSKFVAIKQGGGDLGARLAHVYSLLKEKYKVVVFLGGDSPHLHPKHFEMALEAVSTNDSSFAFGPTEDGGFYIFAGSKPIPSTIWETTEYSLNTTLISLKRKLESIGKVDLIDSFFDVDTFEDLQKLSKYKFPFQPLTEQEELIEWAKKIVANTY